MGLTTGLEKTTTTTTHNDKTKSNIGAVNALPYQKKTYFGFDYHFLPGHLVDSYSADRLSDHVIVSGTFKVGTLH